MGVFKEIARADGTGMTSFYRLDNEKMTVETDSDNITQEMLDYSNILNKPSINDVALIGNKTSEELGLQPAGNYLTEIPEEYITEEELDELDFANKDYVKKAVSEIEHFHREIVDALPKTGKDNVIYMVPKKGTSGDVYNEYIWTGTSYELMGTTAPDLTIFYTRDEADKLLDKKVDKVPGKALSTNDFTNELKSKLEDLENYDDTELRNQVNQFHNYDDTLLQNRVDNLKILADETEQEVNVLQEQIVEKLEAVYLIKSGDSWIWQNRKGDNITFTEAQQLLEFEHYILVIEYLETDGKITPRQYISLNDRMLIYYTDENNREHILTLGAVTNDNLLGYEATYKSSVPTAANLPTSPEAGTICVTEDDNNIYIYTGAKWVAANPNALIDLTQFLAKDNTIAYIPTSDYNPATKKYVDDSIKALDEKKNIPTKLSQLYNDMDFIPKNTVELVNYYTKANSYNKSEIDYMLSLLKTEGRIHTYSWDSNTYEGNANDILAMQVLFDEYLHGEVYNLTLKLKDIKDDFNGLYGIWEFRFDGTNGHLYMGSGDKYYAYGKDNAIGAQVLNSNAIVDIEFTDQDGPYVVTSVTLKRKEDVIANYLSTTTTTNVNYTPTLDGHPATKKYVDDTASGLGQDITDRLDDTDKIIDKSIKTVGYNSSTGILTFTQNDGGTQTIDLPMEFLIQSGVYNSTTRKLELTLANGDIIYINAEDLVDEYFADNTTLSMNANNTFSIKSGYLSDVATSGEYTDLKNRSAIYAPAGGSKNQVNQITISADAPTGGSAGDIWIQY